jgi:hypothetical protein
MPPQRVNPIALKKKGPLGGPEEGRPFLRKGRIAAARKAKRAPFADPRRIYLLSALDGASAAKMKKGPTAAMRRKIPGMVLR